MILGLFQPTDAGTSFSRCAWPALVTLAGTFLVEASLLDVGEGVRRAGLPGSELGVRFGELATLGPGRDVPVRLVMTDEVTSFHHRLADELDSLPGFAADEPAHRRAGYRAHMTLGPLSFHGCRRGPRIPEHRTRRAGPGRGDCRDGLEPRRGRPLRSDRGAPLGERRGLRAERATLAAWISRSAPR